MYVNFYSVTYNKIKMCNNFYFIITSATNIVGCVPNADNMPKYKCEFGTKI